MLLRVRSKSGTWRVPDLSPSSPLSTVKNFIQTHYQIPLATQKLARDPQHQQLLQDDELPLSDYHLGHGDLIYLNYDGDYVVSSNAEASISTRINADGSLSHVNVEDRLSRTGFRPGLKPLRDMKMHWTLGEFTRMDAEFEFKIQAQKESSIAKVKLDTASCNDFQSYLRQFAFQQSRCGWLYGTRDVETNEITVDFIYEPPQSGNPYGFEVHDDPNADLVDHVASLLGKEKVGWVFSHPPREDETFHFSDKEVLLSAQLQADFNESVEDEKLKNLFVTLKVTLNADGEASFEAFHVSQQCVDMFSHGALIEDEANPTHTGVHETFTALVEMKPTKEIDNNFFLCVVPVEQVQSELKSEFPKLNREGEFRNQKALKKLLDAHRNEPFHERVKDFQALVFLSQILDPEQDLPILCESIREGREVNEGHQLVIESVAQGQ